MRRVVLFTGHYYGSRRRAGFHFLADAYHRLGWEVTFATVALSWLSVLRRDHRLGYPVRAEAGELREVAPGLRSFTWFTPYHPGNLRNGTLNRLSTPLFGRYGRRLPCPLEDAVARANLVIFESTPGLLLFDRCKELNERARFVYRVSDDLRLLESHPIVLRTEPRIAPHFDLVSTPSEYIRNLFAGLTNVELQLHGLDTRQFQAPSASPYGAGTTNIVFAGNSHFDYDFLMQAIAAFPNWTFHIIGPIPALPAAPNLAAYGEMPFKETVAYIRHADAGLQIRAYSPGAESLSDSLKVLQYTYCGLGIVAPDFLRSSRSNVFYYRPGDGNSIASSLRAAVAMEQGSVDRSGIRDWTGLAEELGA